MSSKRHSKREYITIDDDEPNEQPVVKNKKAAEPVSSPEVVQLQLKVAELQETNAKLEKNFQGACRIAGESKSRVQFLEKLVDTKPTCVDGANTKEREEELEKKVNDLTNQLDEQRMRLCTKEKRETELEKKVRDLTNKLEQERMDQITRDLTNQLHQERMRLRAKEKREAELEKTLTDLTKELYQERMDQITRLADLTNQLQEERMRRRAKEKRETELEKKVKDLTKQLDQAQVDRIMKPVQQPPQMQHQQQLLQLQVSSTQMFPPPPLGSLQQTDVLSDVSSSKLHDNAHPTNILQMCRPDAKEALSLDSALKKLDAVMKAHGRETVFKYLARRLKNENQVYLHCEVCRKMIPIDNILFHFMCDWHLNKVRAHGGAVSLAAYQHWFGPQESTRAAPAASFPVIATRPAASVAAAAAAPSVRGAAHEVITLD